MNEVKERINDSSWFISHDNFNTPFRVFSQRTNNQGEFANGTAATVYVKPNEPKLHKGLSQVLKETRLEGQKHTLTEQEIFNLAKNSFPVVEHHMVYQVLQFLLESPEFNLQTYHGKDSKLFDPVPPVDQLPVGPEHKTLQYLLGSVGIPEASYEDNARLIIEWLGQLGINTDEAKKRLADESFVVWVGDQLTVDRLRGLYKFRAKDENSFDRLDFVVLAFGWFHLQMAWATSIHKQYLGTPQSRGLQQAFLLLEKKGLTKPLIKGPFHHDLEEALFHIAEAQLRVDWLEEGKVKTLADLREYSPEQIHVLKCQVTRAVRTVTRTTPRRDFAGLSGGVAADTILRLPFTFGDFEGVTGGLSDTDVSGVDDLTDLEGVTRGLIDAEVLGVDGRMGIAPTVILVLMLSAIVLVPSQLSQQM